MRLKSRIKDWRRRCLLRRAGIGVEIEVPLFVAGERSGTWAVDPRGLGPRSVVYSFGVGDNIAWDLSMIRRFGCAVHAFDPTPRSGDYVRSRALPEGFRFHEIGLGAVDGAIWLAPPRREIDPNFRPSADGTGILAPVLRLATHAARLGHRRIDVLKIDIEGCEYEALPDVLSSGIDIRQILIEFHHGAGGIPFEATRSALSSLRRAGFAIFHVSRRGLEFGLERI
ncbi:MAG: hypothetical protein Fur0037_11540 [Planctomycetota bacterium]